MKSCLWKYYFYLYFQIHVRVGCGQNVTNMKISMIFALYYFQKRTVEDMQWFSLNLLVPPIWYKLFFSFGKLKPDKLISMFQKYEVPSPMDDEIQSIVVNRNCELSIFRYHGCKSWYPDYGFMYRGYSLKASLDNVIIEEIEDTMEPLKYFSKDIKCVVCQCFK